MSRFAKRPVLIVEAPRAYLGSARLLFRKRPALIVEAPCAYFRSAQCLISMRVRLQCVFRK